ncbi:MAG: hypoxanthine phosphoribosyltransferase [Ardenticatenaceae bacterium]|nr:hypoxanthine phosphoribosyltransferase [Ardenticatenaceae bacterium]
MPRTDHPDIEQVLIDAATIQARVRELAAEISADYAGVDQLVVVGILKGAFIFLADLTRHLVVPHIVDFMALSSYGASATSSGQVRIQLDLRRPIEGAHVLIVEDIVDTGLTLAYLRETLKARRPASLRACVLLDKAERRQVPVEVEYLGFHIPDVWVVGYGLDYSEAHRTLPFIAVLKPEVYS